MKYKALLSMLILAMSVCLGSCGTAPEESTPAESIQSSEVEQPSEIESSSVWIGLQSAGNARQLGGISAANNRTIKQNMLLRTSEFAGLTDKEEELLTNEYGLAHMIDLRDELEAASSPDPIIEGVQNHHLIVWPRAVRERIIEDSTTDQGFDSELYIRNYYTAFALEPAAIAAYRKMFEVLLENEEGSVLIHCVHGKDRTGIAVTLILSALDVQWEAIEREYLLSNTAYPGSVSVSSLKFYKKVIEENYGSIESYLKAEMNLDGNALTALREKYTVSAQ